MGIDVRSMPVLKLTLIPFLWETDPDSTIIGLVRDMAASPREHEMLSMVHDLLPVADVEVTAHEPVWSTSNHAGELHQETKVILVAEGGDGHYVGMMSGQGHRRRRCRVVARPHELRPGVRLGDRARTRPQHESRPRPVSDPRWPGGWLPVPGGEHRGLGLRLPRNPTGAAEHPRPDVLLRSQVDQRLRFRARYALPTRGRRPRWVRQPGNGAVRPARRNPAAVGRRRRLGQPYLEPAFVVEAPPALPDSAGPHELSGRTADGRELFALSFTMPRTADGGGGGSFAFAVPGGGRLGRPARPHHAFGPWRFGHAGRGHRPPRDDRPQPGDRAGARRPARTARAAGQPVGASAAAVAAESGLQMLYSRGIPDAAAWRR